ncbi:MAG: hypothetical protein KF756_08985 [Acidobacteria bacterium]|nr:hypothetical protein [Acidobacteriota bacterium]
MTIDQANTGLTHRTDSPHPLSDPRSDPTLQKRTDDVIATLAKMPENRRAQQVCEWESMRRRNFKLSL